MSVLGAESYAAVCHLVTDVEALSREERSHVLWYACDGGDLSMVKSVIRAGCDVDQFHRGHTPLMMASIGGHDDVVKELILAGCKVDLRSSKCSVGWFGFITKMASVWPSLALSVMMALLVLLGDWYGLFVLPAALGLVCYDYFKVSRLLRLRSRAQVIAWAGIVPAAVVVFVYIWTAIAEEEEQVVERTVLESLTALASLLMFALTSVLWIGITYAQLKCMAEEMSGIVVAVAVAVTVAVAGSVTGIMAWFTARGEGEIVVRTESVGISVAVAGTLALVLTVTIGGTDELPYAFGATIAAVLTATGIWGLTLQETFLEQSLAVIITVIPAIWFVALPLIEFMKRLSSVTGLTALHYAAWYDHITCGSYLVEAGANMRAENRYFRTPLHICSRRFRAAVQQAQPHPPQEVIAVIGNTEYGKSTLIAALQSESRTFLQSIVCTLSQVYDITQRTAGIETVPFSSAKYGKVLFYDFAGQSDYHGPHQPFLEAILSKAGVTVTVLLLVKVSEAKDVITQQLRRWLQPLALARTPSTPRVIVVGSFLDQAKSKNLAANVQRLQACIDSVQKEYHSVKVQKQYLLDCRQPESEGIEGLRSYLQQTQSIQPTSSVLLYNVHWVMAQLQKAFSGPSLQLNAFSLWLQDNAQNLPTHLPSAENVCQDLSAAGYILFLRNKRDLPQSWLVLDVQAILHKVYGTLFSPRQAVVNQFGLLRLTHLSKLFPKLDPKMLQEVLITLEFCIRVNPSLCTKEMLSLTEKDLVEEVLYFPALVSANVHEVFKQDQQCLHWACWQLETDKNHIIPPHLLQGIILGVAATHVFIVKELPRSVKRHCCSVWVNGLSWGSTTGVDVAIQISDSRVVQVIGRSREGPVELYRYMCSVTQSIFKTIARLSPALEATPYIIHPYTYIGLDESGPSPPTTRYPVASVVGSIEASHKYVHSLPISSSSGSSRVSLQKLFGGWSPSLAVVQCLKEAQEDSNVTTKYGSLKTLYSSSSETSEKLPSSWREPEREGASNLLTDESTLKKLCWIPFDIKTVSIEAKGGVLCLEPQTDDLQETKEDTIFVEIPPDAVSTSDNVKMRYAIIPSGAFTLPEGYQFGSPVVYIYCDGRRITKPLALHLPHCYGGEDHARDGLSFAVAPHSLKRGMTAYQFHLIEGGTFFKHQQYGIFHIDGHSSLFAEVFKEKTTSVYLATQWEQQLASETRTRIVITYNITVWLKILEQYWVNWKRDTGATVDFQFERHLFSRSSVCGKLSNVMGREWKATLIDSEVHKNSVRYHGQYTESQLERLVEERVYPPSIKCAVLYNSPRDFERPSLETFDMTIGGTTKYHVSFPIKVYTALVSPPPPTLVLSQTEAIPVNSGVATAEVTALPFSASQFLKAFKDEFVDVVNAKQSLLKLRHKGVISQAVRASIEAANSDEDAKYLLLEHLEKNATVDTLREYCKVAIEANGYPRMQELGRKMMETLPPEEAVPFSGWIKS